jgi:hypothetical protein
MQQRIRAFRVYSIVAILVLVSATRCLPAALAQPPTCAGSGGTIAIATT